MKGTIIGLDVLYDHRSGNVGHTYFSRVKCLCV